MNITERITQYAGELTQRKLLIENRIEILKKTQTENNQRIEPLEAVKKSIQELQEVYFDYFYNELAGHHESKPANTKPGRVGEPSNIVNLDQAMQAAETAQTKDVTHLIISEPQADLLNNPIRQQKKTGDLSHLLDNIKTIQEKHNRE